MSQQEKQNPRTATAEHSIWREIPENHFREHLVTLEQRTNAVIVRPQVFSLTERSFEEARLLPLNVEQSLADDFAYIAAVGEGAQSVSAVCVEEHVSSPSLTLRLASVDAIGNQVQCALQEIINTLASSATTPDSIKNAQNSEILLRLVVRLHFQKLLGRLRSVKWHKPTYLSRTHKKSLQQDFENLFHRVQHVYPKRKDKARSVVEANVQALARDIEVFENTSTGSDEEFTHLINVVESCYGFCSHHHLRDYATRLEALPKPTSQIAAAVKTLRQVEKVGAYKRISLALVKTAMQHPALFKDIQIGYLHPYFAVESEIGHESWAKTLHVHAEVQLIVYYDVLSTRKQHLEHDTLQCHKPRVIGTSKYLCYLCYLFMTSHGYFLPRNTHGRLYDQWTIPDLVSYNQMISERYRKIIGEMDSRVVQLSEEVGPQNGRRDAWRVEPMTSRQNLLIAPVLQ